MRIFLMTSINFDSEMSSQLRNLREPIEVRDDTGRFLGYFTPVFHLAAYEAAEGTASDEELDRRVKRGTGRTLAEILADLEKRASCGTRSCGPRRPKSRSSAFGRMPQTAKPSARPANGLTDHCSTTQQRRVSRERTIGESYSMLRLV
jgi:hypothetical protein